MLRTRLLAAGVLTTVLVGALSGCASSAVTAAAPSPTPSLAPIRLPAHPTVYFYGDSWTHGASADPGRGFPEVVGEALGWKVQLGPDNSGAGYVHTYNPAHPIFVDAIKDLPPIHADLVVIEGGLNDIPGSPDHKLWETVTATITALKKKAGGAPIVMVGPASPDGVVSEGLSGINYEEGGVAESLGVHYVSPVNEGWFNPDNVKGLVDEETFHPNTAGHAYYAGRLAADLAAITTTR